jgi:uncharacterized Rmd1/YagE family protein
MSRHSFTAVAFAENLSLRNLAAAHPQAERKAHHLRVAGPGHGATYFYSFGAATFQDLPPPERGAAQVRLLAAFPHLGRVVGEEELTVVEETGAQLGVAGGVLTLDRLTPGRASVVAMILAQSAAMEYYEAILDGMFVRANAWVGRLERSGTAPWRARPLHRFIGEAIGVRTEVLSVLHLLDKPNEVWEDPALAAIYDDLRAEFDFEDRFPALELKLRSVQESLELVLDVVRDRRILLLETAIVALIVVEIALSLLR